MFVCACAKVHVCAPVYESLHTPKQMYTNMLSVVGLPEATGVSVGVRGWWAHMSRWLGVK